MATKVKAASLKDVELHRWCIEMAMRWPVHTYGGGYGAAVVGAHGGRSEVDADVLARASKIIAWVKQVH